MTKASQHCAVAPTPVLSGVVLGFARPACSRELVLHVHAPLRYSGHRSAPWLQPQAPELFYRRRPVLCDNLQGLSPETGLSPHGFAGFSDLHGSYYAVSRGLFWSTGYPCCIWSEQNLPAAHLPAPGSRIHKANVSTATVQTFTLVRASSRSLRSRNSPASSVCRLPPYLTLYGALRLVDAQFACRRFRRRGLHIITFQELVNMEF